jgi:hypothetical protein
MVLSLTKNALESVDVCRLPPRLRPRPRERAAMSGVDFLALSLPEI